jgi:hypothetical protein
MDVCKEEMINIERKHERQTSSGKFRDRQRVIVIILAPFVA